MTATIAASSTNKTGNPNTDITVTFGTDGPSGIVAGSLLLGFVGALGGSTTPALATPANWTNQVSSVMTIGTVRNIIGLFWLIADGTETAVTFTATPDTATNGMTAKVLRISGHSTSNPINASIATAAGGNVTTYTVNGVTTTVDDCLAFYAVAAAGVRTFTPSGSLTEQWDFSSNPGTGDSQAAATLIKATAGATGNQSYDPNTNSTIVGITAAIAPADTGGLFFSG